MYLFFQDRLFVIADRGCVLYSSDKLTLPDQFNDNTCYSPVLLRCAQNPGLEVRSGSMNKVLFSRSTGEITAGERFPMSYRSPGEKEASRSPFFWDGYEKTTTK